MAVYDDLAEERLRIFDRGIRQDVPRHKEHAMPVSYRYGDIVSPHINFEEPLLLEDRHFIDCIRNSERPTSDVTSGFAVVSVLSAIDRAMASGQRVAVFADAPSLVPEIVA